MPVFLVMWEKLVGREVEMETDDDQALYPFKPNKKNKGKNKEMLSLFCVTFTSPVRWGIDRDTCK